MNPESTIVKITGLSFFEGLGVGKTPEGKIVFVEYGCPGDLLKVSIYKSKKNYSYATIDRILEASNLRVKPECNWFESCGGCSLQHVNYSLQVSEKNKVLERYVTKSASQAELKPFETSEQKYNYRERIEVHIKNNKWGFYKKKSDDLIFPKSCATANQKINEQLQQPLNLTDGHYHIDSEGIKPRSRGNNGVFSQINSEINLKLKGYLEITLNLNKNNLDQVYDLYAGSGNYSLHLAPKFNSLCFTAVELSKVLVNFGKAAQNKIINNIEWVNQDTEHFLKSSNINNSSMIIVNPPRNGLSNEIVQELKLIKPYLLCYISCNPMTLFRDIDALSPKYKLYSLKGFDMFPQTMHFETVALIKPE